jgi:hypothetical protein
MVEFCARCPEIIGKTYTCLDNYFKSSVLAQTSVITEQSTN